MKTQRLTGLATTAGLSLVAAVLLLSGCETAKPVPSGPAPRPSNDVALAQGTPRPVNPAFAKDLSEPTRPVVTPPSASDVDSGILEPVTDEPVNLEAQTVYVVEAKDTLSRIAKRFGVTVAAIKSANALTSDVIKVGQKLEIPAGPTETADLSMAVEGAPGAESLKDYVVVSGDSLSRIAVTYSVSVADLKAVNHLSSDVIRVGQKLKLPAYASEAKALPAPKAAPVSSVKSSGLTYKVQNGDTIGGIAARTGVKQKDLMSLNGITDPKKLRVGKVLELPEGAHEPSAASSNTAPDIALPQTRPQDSYMLPTSNVMDEAPAPVNVQPDSSASSSTQTDKSALSELEDLDDEPALPTVPVESDNSEPTDMP